MEPGTIIPLVILSLIVVAIITKIVKDKKSGKSSCGCDCGSCGSDSVCHKK